LNPCTGLPTAAHLVYISLQNRYRIGRAFDIDLERLAVTTELDREQLRDELADLIEIGVLRQIGEKHMLTKTCDCAKDAKLQKQKAYRTPAQRLADLFQERVDLLEPMGVGNAGAVSRNMSALLNAGYGDEAIRLMIDNFIENFRTYCSGGRPPWKALISRRHQIMREVQERWEAEHCWDEEFDEKLKSMFPRPLGALNG
jgi:hypothetical protein